MLTPYDWQEGIGNRAQYIEGKLAQGAPVARPQPPRGHPAPHLPPPGAQGLRDLRPPRLRRRRPAVRRRGDPQRRPGVRQQGGFPAQRGGRHDPARRERHERPAQARLRRLRLRPRGRALPLRRGGRDARGRRVLRRSTTTATTRWLEGPRRRRGHPGSGRELDRALADVRTDGDLEETVEALKPIWARAVDPDGDQGDDATKGLTLEVALMDRRPGRENRFRLLEG